jgi:glycerol-3-phosphate dehydrogenase (NAD(P)+)
MAVIVILGAGMMGSAMSYPARKNGNEVRLVGTPLDRAIIDGLRKDDFHITLKRTLPEGVKYYQIEELDEALAGADLLISGVSSFGVSWFAEEMLPRLSDELPILGITKGMFDMEDGSLVPYPIYYKSLPQGANKRFYAVGGPCTSYELADLDPTEVAFCGPDIETLRWIKSLFNTDFYHISLSTDIIGVECAVAMKNAYALGVTLAVGLSERTEGVGGKQHYNSQAALFGQSVREMRRLLRMSGGKDDNIMLGAGDLYVTVFGGRTRFIGTLLGRGMSFDEAMEELKGVTLESIVIATRTARAVRRLVELGKARKEDYPLLMHIDDVISHGAEVNIPWSAFETETF